MLLLKSVGVNVVYALEELWLSLNTGDRVIPFYKNHSGILEHL